MKYVHGGRFTDEQFSIDETITEIPFGEESGKTYEYEYCILEFLQ